MSMCVFFENGVCVELMEVYIRKGFEIIDGLYFCRGYVCFLFRILDVDFKFVGEFLRKVYIFYDVGKCFEEF